LEAIHFDMHQRRERLDARVAVTAQVLEVILVERKDGMRRRVPTRQGL
jgi:hypothetical protein